MKASRTINPSDVRMIYFGTKDVLENHEEKEERRSKLQRAILRNNNDMPVNLYLRLPNGETVETQSEMVDCNGDYVIIEGRHSIPVGAILDVDS